MNRAHNAIHEAVKHLGKDGRVVTSKEIIKYIHANHPDVADGSILPADCCDNTITAKKVPGKKFLHSVGRGQFVLIDSKSMAESVQVQSAEEYLALTSERDLEDFVSKNLNQIEEGLRIYKWKEGETSLEGRQYYIGKYNWRIDILAKDKDDNFVVIELKAGKAGDNVVGQTQGYMTWVEENLADGKKVRGIIIANDFDERVKLCKKKCGFELKKYSVKYFFTSV
jgi:hypothetical protein